MSKDKAIKCKVIRTKGTKDGGCIVKMQSKVVETLETPLGVTKTESRQITFYMKVDEVPSLRVVDIIPSDYRIVEKHHIVEDENGEPMVTWQKWLFIPRPGERTGLPAHRDPLPPDALDDFAAEVPA